MARIKEDAERVWEGTSFGIMLVVEAIVNLCIASYLMLRISPKLSIITFITLPLLGWLT